VGCVLAKNVGGGDKAIDGLQERCREGPAGGTMKGGEGEKGTFTFQ